MWGWSSDSGENVTWWRKFSEQSWCTLKKEFWSHVVDRLYSLTLKLLSVVFFFWTGLSFCVFTSVVWASPLTLTCVFFYLVVVFPQRTVPVGQNSLILQPLLSDTEYKIALTPVYPDGDGPIASRMGRTREFTLRLFWFFTQVQTGTEVFTVYDPVFIVPEALKWRFNEVWWSLMKREEKKTTTNRRWDQTIRS